MGRNREMSVTSAVGQDRKCREISIRERPTVSRSQWFWLRYVLKALTKRSYLSEYVAPTLTKIFMTSRALRLPNDRLQQRRRNASGTAVGCKLRLGCLSITGASTGTIRVPTMVVHAPELSSPGVRAGTFSLPTEY